MRNLFAKFVVLTVLFSTNVMYAWALVNDMSSSESILKAGNVIIAKKPSISIDNGKSVVSFVVDMKQAGIYYLSCWMLGGQYSDGGYSSYDVSVNGVAIGNMNAIKANWQSVKLNTGVVVLQKGKNTISFAAQIPEIPNVEFIKLSTTQENAIIPSANYDNNLKRIKENCAAAKYNMLTMPTDTLPNINQMRMAVDEEAYYHYVPNIPLRYTFYTTAHYTQGQDITFSVTNVSGANTVVEIFHQTQPENYSWSWMTALGGTASHSVECPATGVYMIRLRSYQNARDGIANITVGGITYTDVPTYSYGITYSHIAGIEYNTFTTNLKINDDGEGDPMLYVGKGFPDMIVAYNDDYSGNGNWYWGYESRIKKQFAENTKSVFVSEYYAYEGNSRPYCDLYIGCRSCRIDTLFENLHHDDVIESAPETPEETYNCISWSGGINSYWEWPLWVFSDYHVSGDSLACFDMFYLYPRYYGCGIYSRNGATEFNSVVDLWGYIEEDGHIEYTHASIKHGADNHPHGYDWESKIGSLSRIFHPRYALAGDPDEEEGGYGEVFEHYRLVGIGNPITSEVSALEEGDRIITLEESIADGYSVLEHVQFTDVENSLINAKIGDISDSNITQFYTKYQAWKNSCSNIHSMFGLYKNSEYDKLLAFCRTFKNSEFLIYRQLGEGDIFSMLLVCDLILSGNAQNRNILNGIKEENKNNRIKDNVTIVHSPYSNTMKFVKRLINNTYLQQTRGAISSNEGIKYSNSDKFIASTTNNGLMISFNIPEDASISLSVRDLQGHLLTSVLQNKVLEKGSHSYLIETPSTDICLVCYSVNGNLNVKKLYVR